MSQNSEDSDEGWGIGGVRGPRRVKESFCGTPRNQADPKARGGNRMHTSWQVLENRSCEFSIELCFVLIDMCIMLLGDRFEAGLRSRAWSRTRGEWYQDGSFGKVRRSPRNCGEVEDSSGSPGGLAEFGEVSGLRGRGYNPGYESGYGGRDERP